MNRLFFREAGGDGGSNHTDMRKKETEGTGQKLDKKSRKKLKNSGEHQHADQMNIAFTGLTRSAGVTFAASAFALYCAEAKKSVQFTQCLNPSSPAAGPLLFDAVAMDRRFANRPFHDVSRLIREGRSLRGIKNLELGVNWMLPVPENRTWTDSLNSGEKARLIHNARGEICIFDFQVGDGWDQFLLDMDLIVVIVDPLPSKLIEGAERFKMLKKMEMSGGRSGFGVMAAPSGAACQTGPSNSAQFAGIQAGSPPQICWVVNRVSSGVNRRQVAGYLKNNDLLWIKNFPAEEIYGDEFACRFHWENPEIKCHLLDIFTKISQEYLIL